MAATLLILTRHTVSFFVLLLDILQLGAAVDDENRQLDGARLLVSLGMHTRDAVVDKMRRFLLFVLGVPSTDKPHDGAGGGNGDNSQWNNSVHNRFD